MSRNKRKKKQDNRKNGASLLAQWQKERLERDLDFPLPAPGPSEITVVTYFVPDGVMRDAAFERTECALMETWRNCGFMRSVIVTDAPSEAATKFADRFEGKVEVQIEQSLSPTHPETIAADRAGKLPERFRTPMVLLVSEDAFPLRPGIGSFIDRFDFVGAPHPLSDLWVVRAASALFGIRAMDGAFSLRSRSLCFKVAAAWKARFDGKPVPANFSDGLFATSFLPSHSLAFRREMRLPAFAQAHRFAVGTAFSSIPSPLPFGFSGTRAFAALSKAGLV